MARTTAQAFGHFYDSYVAPTRAQRENVSTKKSKTYEYLKEAFPNTSDMPIASVVLIGSADRGTHIQPVADIDVLAKFSNEDGAYDRYRYSSGDFLQRIRTALDAKTNIKQIGARGQAVRLFYVSGSHVDIAPVFEWQGGGFALPAGNGGWTTTDPIKQAEWMAQRKRQIGSNLGKVIRYAKVWNNVHSKHFNSYHLEVLVASLFSAVGGDTRDALKIFFGSAMDYLEVHDPVGHSGDLSTYMTSGTKSALRTRFANAHDRAIAAINAENRGDHAEAKRLWRLELGSNFPTA